MLTKIYRKKVREQVKQVIFAEEVKLRQMLDILQKMVPSIARIFLMKFLRSSVEFNYLSIQKNQNRMITKNN